MSVKSYAQSVRDVIAEEMRKDEAVFIMGEDVAEQGGIFGCTRGLLDEFGEKRVRNTPISEAAFVGAGIGAACTGMRPIVELMYMDFAYVAMDQILNQAAKIRYMFGGKAKVPMVIRGQQGVGRGNAGQHSQSVEAFFMHIPGIKVAMPSSAADAAGLLRTAIRDDNPIMFFEHKALYATSGEVPDDPDFMIPFGQANVVREGKDVTVIATHLYVNMAVEIAEKLAKEGIDVEVIDPRTLVPLDKETMIQSVKKTGRAVVVHEAHRTAGVGAELAAVIAEEAFIYLDAPVERLGAKQCTLPFNLALENAVVPQEEDIVRAIKKVLYK
jgi:acetoin:2,6-dichlorophenolindophenol oxidoreductase subunit beta